MAGPLLLPLVAIAWSLTVNHNIIAPHTNHIAYMQESSGEAFCEEDECALPEVGLLVNDIEVKPSTIRNLELQGASANSVRIGDVVGDEGKALVVFLRHLG